MITVVIVKNTFEPKNGREVQNIEYKGSIGNLAKLYDFGTPIRATLNGYSVDYETQVKDGDFVVLFPEVAKSGKSILGIVAVIALSVVSMGAGAAVAGTSTLGAATGWAAVGGWLTAAGIMFVGNTLIGRFMGIKDRGRYDSENNPTYSWGDVQTMEGQNNAIALTYGKVKSAGQTIGKYINVVDDKEYLNWLVSAGEGPLKISDIKLNDNSINAYEGILADVRPGTNDQEIISNFNDTYFTKSLGYQLLEQPRTDTAQGNSTEALIVKVEFSNGLYYANDNGSLGEAWVELGGWYHKKGTSEWKELIGQHSKITNSFRGTELADENAPAGKYSIYSANGQMATLTHPDGYRETVLIPSTETFILGPFSFSSKALRMGEVHSYITVEKANERITGSQSSALRREYRVDNLEPGEYEVKLQVMARSVEITSSRASVRCWWSAITSVVYDDFSYPCTALVGLKAMATDQISGSPNLSFIKERSVVLVWNPYNGAYVAMPANNPAWASYDALHLCSKLKNVNTGLEEYEVRGCRRELLLYDQFKEWADFCDEKNLHVNIEINTTGELLDVINQNIANCGRGMVVRFGTKFGCIFDCVKQPTQMFGMGNIKAGTFNEEFLPTNDRANCVEVTYTDAENDYSRQTITIYGENYDSSAEEKIAQVTYNGITSYEQAYREGMYQLYCNKYQLRTVTFEADIDAIACTVGDVVLVAHDVPKWAHSGRIAQVNGQELLLPVELEDISGNYRIMYRTIDDKLYTSNVDILQNGGGKCRVWVKNALSYDNEPQPGDIFDLALVSVGSKPFIVKAITRAQDFTRKIECLEYQEALYNEDYDIPPVNYSPEQQKAQDVAGLNAKQMNYIRTDGVTRAKLYASWEKPNNGGTFTVLLSTDGEKFKILHSGYAGTTLEEDLPADTEYWLKVITVLGVSQSQGVVIGPIPVDVDKLPPDVTNLETEVLADGTRRYYWDFTYPDPNDIAGFKFKYLQGTVPNWNKAYDVQEGLIISQPFETKTVRQGAHTIMVKAVDNNGQESENYAACAVDFGDPLRENVIYEKDYSLNGWEDVETNGLKNSLDGCIHAQQTSFAYSSPYDYAYSTPEDYAYDQYYSAFYAEVRFNPIGSGDFYLLYDIEGISNITYKSLKYDKSFKQYSTKVKAKSGDIIVIRFESQEGTTDTVLKKLIAVVDVPDRTEHFPNFHLFARNNPLPVKTPNYVTTAVHCNGITMDGKPLFLDLVNKNPCVVRAVDSNGTPVECDVDITWQGFIKEI